MNGAMNVARLVHVCGSIEGRKKLQKMVHLLGELGFQKDFPYEFGYLHFGPYSIGLKGDLEALERSNLIDETRKNSGPFPLYCYKAKPELSEVLKRFKLDSPPEWSEAATKLNTCAAQTLEAASTLQYLRRLGCTDESTRFRDLKPGLVDEFESATNLLQELSKAVPEVPDACRRVP